MAAWLLPTCRDAAGVRGLLLQYWAALRSHPDGRLVKPKRRDCKAFMGGFSAYSKFQGTILQSLDSRLPLLPTPHREGKDWGFHSRWGGW